MTARFDELPEGYIQCVWCGHGIKHRVDGRYSACSSCGLNPMPGEDRTKGGKVDPTKAAKSKRNTQNAPKQGKLNLVPIGKPVLGVDPGARYTGVVLRDGDAVLHASTLVRSQDMESGTDWALEVVKQVEQIHAFFKENIPVAIEGISDPKGFQNGKKAAINPKDIIRAGIVLGALVQRYPDSFIVKPGNNGSQHYTHYPDVLIGRRPTDLPGSSNSAGTRNHEQSAYDVAGKASDFFYPRNTETIIFS
jgi:hypothetical protein